MTLAEHYRINAPIVLVENARDAQTLGLSVILDFAA